MTSPTSPGHWTEESGLPTITWGIQHYDIQKKQFSAAYNYKTIKGLPGRYWIGMDDGEGNLYIGHVTDGLSIIDMKRNTFRNYRHDPHNPNSIPR